MRVMKLFGYSLRIAYQPIQTIEALLQDRQRVAYAAISLLLLGLLYTITVVIGYSRGFGAVTTPLLAIPAEEYYYWEAFFMIPVYFVAVILFAGIGRILALWLGGKGSFDDIFAIFALAFLLPTLLFLWLPETALIVFFPDQRLTPLGGFELLPLWVDIARQILGGAWPVIVAIVGIKISQRLNWVQSIGIATLATIPTVAMILVFIR